ncbi:MAG TPA: large conductance mechanosensitive channel protein MscL [Bacillota bacterium]|nr:large conductance mechanosensitive channel protein MscL [Bacillota bacterium]HPJ24075.1 large conductance mechanosensitive channel protein MscL [Bacillota bacterium]
MKKFFSEFGKFISKGNALDLAVGIIIGGAFNKIVSSLVKDIVMPLLSLIFQTDITQLVWVMKGTRTFDSVTGTYILSENAVVMYYGSFIQTIIDFLIIAMAIFVAIKLINKFKEKLDSLKEIIAEKLDIKEEKPAEE